MIDNKRNNIWASVTTFDKATDTCNYKPLGGFMEATERLHTVSVHDVQDVTRTTRTVKGTKVTTITIHTANGSVDINCFREH